MEARSDRVYVGETLSDDSSPATRYQSELTARAAEGATTPAAREHNSDSRSGQPLAAALRGSFAKYGMLPAVEGRQVQLSYRDLDRRSASFARALGDAGVVAGDIVPLLLRRSPDMIVAQVALIRMGAAYAPIDATSPAARQLAMMQQISPKVVLADRPVAMEGISPEQVLQVDSIDTLTPIDTAAFWHDAADDSLAYVMFTSGTTGVPKGVMIPQSGIRRLVVDANFANMQVGSRWAYASSPAFDASTLETWAPLLNGGCAVVQEIANPSIDDLADFLTRENITDAWLTAALFSALVDDRLDAFRGLSQLLTGGERVSPFHAKKVLTAYHDLHLINGYGPTENTTFTLCHPISLSDTDHPQGIPIGLPIAGTTVRIGSDLDDANEGELLAGGLGAALGYLGDPALTALKFIEVAGERWYRTGDLVRRASRGAPIEFVGRVDRQVKLQGYRVELDEVERAIRQYPGVSNAVVQVKGVSAESRHLVAHYTVDIRSSVNPDSLQQSLRERLVAQAIPGHLKEVGRLPINANGKVDLVALDLETTSNAEDRSSNQVKQVAGSDSVEQRLIGIWSRIFQTASIHNNSNFSEIGGNSLLALQLSAQVRRLFGRDLTPLDILRNPVLADQAKLIETAPVFDYEPTSPASPDPQLELTQSQRMMLAASEFDESQCSLLVHVALQLPSALAPRAVEGALATLALRHPMLRLRLTAGVDSAQGRVAPTLAAGWWRNRDAVIDVPEQFRWPAEVLGTINRPLDLKRDGVMRADSWRLADGSSLVVWTIHHIAVDEASIDRALADLNQILAGATLPNVYGSPTGFAAFEKSAVDRKAAEFWSARLLSVLSGVTPPLPRSPAIGSEFSVEIPEPLSRQLTERSRTWGMTPFTPLLAAFGRALQEVFGPEQRFVSTPFSRRADEDLIEPFGCLIDLRVVEAGMESGESDVDALKRINIAVQQLQRPTFFPRTSVFEAIARRDANVAHHLNMFGFTWRLNPERHIPLARQTGRLLRVPQIGARFGVTLHAWTEGEQIRCSIEAIDAAIADGRARNTGDAFVRHLTELVELNFEATSPQDRRSDTSAFLVESGDSATEKVRRVWANRLGISPNDVNASSHFLYQGGNSLAAMRLASELRRAHGFAVDVGKFLARPTFGELCTLVSTSGSHVPGCSVMLGATDAPNVIVLLPGNIGTSLGSYRLAEELLQRLGRDYAVAIVELETMLLRAPQDDIVSYLDERVAQLANELGWQRIAAVAGLSSGGLLALKLVARRSTEVGHNVDVPVWLIDTYAPMDSIQAAIQHNLRPIARYVVRHPVVATLTGGKKAIAKQESEGLTVLAQLKHDVHQQMYKVWGWPSMREVHLVQAVRTVRDVALLWRRDTNGFKTNGFEHFQIHPLDGSHSELSRELAPATASLIVDSLQKHRQKR